MANQKWEEPLSRVGALVLNQWLDDRSRMNREVHVRICEDVIGDVRAEIA